MAFTSNGILTAVLISLFLIAAPVQANDSQAPETSQAQKSGLLATEDDSLMRAIVRRYREMTAAITRALAGDDDFKEMIATKQKEDRIAAALSANPDLLKPRTPVPTPTPRTPPPVVVDPPPVVVPPVVVRPPAPAAVGSARLTWNIPTQRENGSTLNLTEIASYEIYMTAESTGTSRTIRVSDPGKTQFTLVPLPADTYHFSMVTIDNTGTYSGLSEVVSKTVR